MRIGRMSEAQVGLQNDPWRLPLVSACKAKKCYRLLPGGTSVPFARATVMFALDSTLWPPVDFSGVELKTTAILIHLDALFLSKRPLYVFADFRALLKKRSFALGRARRTARGSHSAFSARLTRRATTPPNLRRHLPHCPTLRHLAFRHKARATLADVSRESITSTSTCIIGM